MARSVANDGVTQIDTVPEGHHWILKNLTWCEQFGNPSGVQTYKIEVGAVFKGGMSYMTEHRMIMDSKLRGQRAGEWAGRIVLAPGDDLWMIQYTEPMDGLQLVTVSVHGFDFIGP